jgi:hypothetical protein
MTGDQAHRAAPNHPADDRDWLAVAERRVAECHEAIKAQTEIVAGCRQLGGSTESLEKLLASIERLQAIFEADLARLVSERNRNSPLDGPADDELAGPGARGGSWRFGT